jgi:hypothetical protein
MNHQLVSKSLRQWLGVSVTDPRVTESDAAVAREVRDALLAVLLSHAGLLEAARRFGD